MPAFLRILKRVMITLPVIWLVVTVVFLLIHIVPGDPIVQMLGDGATSTDIAALRHSYGLDAPLSQQYVHYWLGLLHGDLGRSLRLHDSVLHLILQRYPYTLALTVAATILGSLLAIPAAWPLPAARTSGRTARSALSASSGSRSRTSRLARS